MLPAPLRLCIDMTNDDGSATPIMTNCKFPVYKSVKQQVSTLKIMWDIPITSPARGELFLLRLNGSVSQIDADNRNFRCHQSLKHLLQWSAHLEVLEGFKLEVTQAFNFHDPIQFEQVKPVQNLLHTLTKVFSPEQELSQFPTIPIYPKNVTSHSIYVTVCLRRQVDNTPPVPYIGRHESTSVLDMKPLETQLPVKTILTTLDDEPPTVTIEYEASESLLLLGERKASEVMKRAAEQLCFSLNEDPIALPVVVRYH
ncbi:hypothetical protein CVT24_012897 [Panaeolus cyanescens]|uniref:Uncharacterized protein n=1 Tax=Panaeolus cyanescens TaxID=181874 RepID=A0A409W2S8_9AGAR|nr:hypothetical protein CVT24_012897 [Panaeolus cyanescens]